MLSIFKYFPSIGDGYVHNYQADLPPHTSTVTCEYFSNLINVMHVFNLVCAGQMIVHAWFLIIAFVLEVCD